MEKKREERPQRCTCAGRNLTPKPSFIQSTHANKIWGNLKEKKFEIHNVNEIVRTRETAQPLNNKLTTKNIRNHGFERIGCEFLPCHEHMTNVYI